MEIIIEKQIAHLSTLFVSQEAGSLGSCKSMSTISYGPEVIIIFMGFL